MAEQQQQRTPQPHEAVLFVWRRDQSQPIGPILMHKDDALKLMKVIEDDGGVRSDRAYTIYSLINDDGRQQVMYFCNVEAIVIDRALGVVPPSNMLMVH